jgi:hypothetical protein
MAIRMIGETKPPHDPYKASGPDELIHVARYESSGIVAMAPDERGTGCCDRSEELELFRLFYRVYTCR